MARISGRFGVSSFALAAALGACTAPGGQPVGGAACGFDVQGRVDPADCTYRDTPAPTVTAPPPAVAPPPAPAPAPPAPAPPPPPADNDGCGDEVVL